VRLLARQSFRVEIAAHAFASMFVRTGRSAGSAEISRTAFECRRRFDFISSMPADELARIAAHRETAV
jgi:hypothetical protein